MRGAVILVAIGLVALVGCAREPSPTADKDDVYYPIREDNAGEYQTVGPRDGGRCEWARASEPSGDAGDFIDVGSAPANRNTTVTLRAGDYFISWGCYPWRRQ